MSRMTLQMTTNGMQADRQPHEKIQSRLAPQARVLLATSIELRHALFLFMDAPNDYDPYAYRAGYREGFRDGFGESVRLAPGTGDRDRKQDDKNKNKDKDKKQQGSGDDDAQNDAKEKDEDKNNPKNDEQSDEEQDKKKGKGDDKPPVWKRPWIIAIALVVLLALIIGGIIFWRKSQAHESTDDAFIDGQTSQVAAQTSGRVTQLYVSDNQFVEKGAALLDIDSRDDDAQVQQAQARRAAAEGQKEQANALVAARRAATAEAEASVAQASAELTKAAQDAQRYRKVDPDAVPRQQVDAAQAAERSARARLQAARMSVRAANAQIGTAQAQANSAQAQIEAAQAVVDAAQLQGSYTHVVAPVAGRVAKRTVDPGNVISKGQPLMAIVGRPLWVTANFKETQLTRMKPGLAVKIVVDAYPDVALDGHIDSIQRATGAYFSALPAQNATGNYVKVVQRVPVKIVFDEDKRLDDYVIGPGMSVVPTVTLPDD